LINIILFIGWLIVKQMLYRAMRFTFDEYNGYNSSFRSNAMLNSPHRRFNPLTNEWVLVSPQRTDRPWLGQVEENKRVNLPQYDPKCSLCPGNTRASGKINPVYTNIFVFDNDFPALLSKNVAENAVHQHLLLREEAETGYCKVVCFSPRHDLTLPDMSVEDVEAILSTWADESEQLGKRQDITYVQVFENKGAMMGCSNPHPHSQIWASSLLPNEPAKELAAQHEYFDQHKRPLLLDYGKLEIDSKDRIVASNEYFIAVVPFWAIWPFEIMVLSTQTETRLADSTSQSRRGLAEIMLEVTRRYDRLFNVSFPYSMGFHQAPYDGKAHPEWVLHAHFYPPLLRSATIRKFMVGYELMAMPQRDITPEAAAKVLRSIKL
jgi:UDPglucose--hexose-1-phosphate uridylyltransferase